MQLRLPIPKSCRSPRPTIRDPLVAERIAKRIVAEVNLDEFYWTAAELPDRIWDVTQEIILAGNPRTVFSRLYRKQPPCSCSGERGGHPYGWEGIDEHCDVIADEIANDELFAARDEWHKRWEQQ